MKKFINRHGSEFAFAFVAIICAFFFAYVVSLSSLYFSSVTQSAQKRADFYTQELSLKVEEKCTELKQDAEFFAAKLASARDEEEAQTLLKDLYLANSTNPKFVSAFRFKNGKLISWDGATVSGYDALNDLKDITGTVLSRTFQYDNHIMSIASSAPVESEYTDRVVVLYDNAAVTILEDQKNAENVLNAITYSEFAVLCKYDGRVIDLSENTNTFTVGNEPVQDGILNSILNDTNDRTAANELFHNGGYGSFIFRYDTDEYVLTINSFGYTDGNLSMLAAYKVSNIYGEGFRMMEGIKASLIGLGAVMVIMIIFMIIARIESLRSMFKLEMIDSLLNCATPKKFERDVSEIIKRHKSASFAIVSMKINNFGYVSEKYGDTASEEIARYSMNVIRQALMVEETFAYAGDGNFLILLHYRERQAFSGRLNGIYLRLSAFNGMADGNYKISASFSIYEVAIGSRESVKSMLDKLKIVSESATVQIGCFSACFYEDILAENHLRKAEIEGSMEYALENNEFHLFYQPKYNLRSKTMDGCEILVRWYDPKAGSYLVPSIFLPVFEEDGFITKIDHFIFYRACENIAERIAKGGICYPVSVNVSRVTAIQPDFTEYYIRIKNKFGIQDNFITLEFTESFAFENYDYLSETVEALHRNGFLCSIDDFGTGYSSYNILKTIDMDEIKLDKFFLGEGISKERDETLLKSVIDMIKKLGMKVTQEGVETVDDLRRMESLGCDVIQGYCFAKPMKYVDYCDFIDNNFVKK